MLYLRIPSSYQLQVVNDSDSITVTACCKMNLKALGSFLVVIEVVCCLTPDFGLHILVGCCLHLKAPLQSLLTTAVALAAAADTADACLRVTVLLDLRTCPQKHAVAQKALAVKTADFS